MRCPSLSVQILRLILARALRRLRLGAHSVRGAPNDLIVATLRRWSHDPGVRIADDATMTIDRDGIWISAWLLAGDGAAGVGGLDRLVTGLRILPVITREVYLLHRRDDLDYAAIGARLGIGVDEVERLLAHALSLLDEELMKGRDT